MYPQKMPCTPKIQPLGVHVPSNKFVSGHADIKFYFFIIKHSIHVYILHFTSSLFGHSIVAVAIETLHVHFCVEQNQLFPSEDLYQADHLPRVISPLCVLFSGLFGSPLLMFAHILYWFC